MTQTTNFLDYPWPSATAYSGFIAIIFTVLFVKALVNAIQRSTRLHNDGTVGVGAFGQVAGGYVWVTISFWVAALGFIAAYKG